MKRPVLPNASADAAALALRSTWGVPLRSNADLESPHDVQDEAWQCADCDQVLHLSWVTQWPRGRTCLGCGGDLVAILLFEDAEQ